MKKAKGTSLENSVAAPAPQDDYETQGHLDTLIKAHGIMADPEKMNKVHALAGRQHKALKGIAKVKVTSTDQLRKLSNKKYGAGGDPDAKVEDLEEGAE